MAQHLKVVNMIGGVGGEREKKKDTIGYPKQEVFYS